MCPSVLPELMTTKAVFVRPVIGRYTLQLSPISGHSPRLILVSLAHKHSSRRIGVREVQNMSELSKAAEFLAQLNQSRASTFEAEGKNQRKENDVEQAVIKNIPHPTPITSRNKAKRSIELKASGKVLRAASYQETRATKKMEVQGVPDTAELSKADAFLAQLNMHRISTSETNRSHDKPKAGDTRRGQDENVELSERRRRSRCKGDADKMMKRSVAEVSEVADVSALSKADLFLAHLNDDLSTTVETSSEAIGADKLDEALYQEAETSSIAISHYESLPVDIDVDCVTATIRTEDLHELMIQPVRLAGYPSRLAVERVEYYQSFRKGSKFLLITTTPVQLMVFGSQAQLQEIKHNLWDKLHQRDVMFYKAKSSINLAHQETQCSVPKLQEALIESKVRHVRLYLFGQKENLRSCVARYDEAIERAFSLKEDGDSASPLDESVCDNAFDFGKSFIATDSDVTQIPIFEIGAPINQSLDRTQKRKTHRVFGGDFGDFGWISGAATLSDGHNVIFKIYPTYVHLLKASKSRWSVEPKDKRALVERLSSLDKLLSDLVVLEPFRLCGYRVEVTVRGRSMTDAANIATRHNLVSLHGICKLVNIRVRLVQVSKYLESFYIRMHNALQDHNITSGSGKAKLTEFEVAIYHGLLNQIGFNFGNQTKRHLRDDWKTCLCHLLTTRIHRSTKSRIKVDPANDVIEASALLQYCVRKISSHPKSKQIVEVYRAIFSKADLAISVCVKSNLDKCLVYYDIFRYADMFWKKGKKEQHHYVFRDLQYQFLGQAPGVGSCVEKIYRKWRANWREHVRSVDGRSKNCTLEKLRESAKARRLEVMSEFQLEECDFTESDFGHKLENIRKIEINRKTPSANEVADATAREIKKRLSAQKKESTKATLCRRYPRDGYQQYADKVRNRIPSKPRPATPAYSEESSRMKRNQSCPASCVPAVASTKLKLLQGGKAQNPVADAKNARCSEMDDGAPSVLIPASNSRGSTGPWYLDVETILSVEKV